MTRDQIIAEIKRTADANGGLPPGERRFFKETGLTLRVMQRAGFSNYGEAREGAGYPRGLFGSSKYSDDEIFAQLSQLTREKERFPTQGELRVAGYTISGWPSDSTYARVKKRGPLPTQLSAWCQTRPEYADVLRILESTQAAPVKPTEKRGDRDRVVKGYVYLMRYGASGKEYKIGCTDNVDRRHSQIDMMSPQDVRKVWIIDTDDPRGIEKYWLERFADKRVKTKEIFRLSADDVAAFKRRRYQ
jgi:hypothetical protein